MSSLDGIGRYYPLTLFACATPGNAIAPPDIDAHDQWFTAVEDFLLSTLDNKVAFERITDALEQLAAPAQRPKGFTAAGYLDPEERHSRRPVGKSVFFRSLCAAPHRKSFQSLCHGKLLVDRGRPRLRPIRFLLPAIA